jgi:hypothetical protein
MQKVMVGISFDGANEPRTAWTEMYITPKGLFPVLGEPISFNVTDELPLGGLI